MSAARHLNYRLINHGWDGGPQEKTPRRIQVKLFPLKGGNGPALERPSAAAPRRQGENKTGVIASSGLPKNINLPGGLVAGRRWAHRQQVPGHSLRPPAARARHRGCSGVTRAPVRWRRPLVTVTDAAAGRHPPASPDSPPSRPVSHYPPNSPAAWAGCLSHTVTTPCSICAISQPRAGHSLCTTPYNAVVITTSRLATASSRQPSQRVRSGLALRVTVGTGADRAGRRASGPAGRRSRLGAARESAGTRLPAAAPGRESGRTAPRGRSRRQTPVSADKTSAADGHWPELPPPCRQEKCARLAGIVACKYKFVS